MHQLITNLLPIHNQVLHKTQPRTPRKTHLCDNLLAAFGQVVDLAAVAHNEHQIRDVPQRLVLSKRFDERRDVLLCVGAAHREHHGLGAVCQEAIDALHAQQKNSQDMRM